MRFRKQTLKEACPTIDLDFELELSGNRIHVVPMLIVSISGRYRDGSAGAPDAACISGRCRTAIDLWDARAVILDLTQLSYEWGDDFDNIYTAAAQAGAIHQYESRHVSHCDNRGSDRNSWLCRNCCCNSKS